MKMEGMLSGRVTRILRGEYGGPIDPGYWDGLERRIVAFVETAARPVRLVEPSHLAIAGAALESDPGAPWAQAFRAWSRAGAIAAGLAVLFAGAALWRTREMNARTAAYATVFAAPASLVELPDGASY
jgi:hypothetical protein